MFSSWGCWHAFRPCSLVSLRLSAASMRSTRPGTEEPGLLTGKLSMIDSGGLSGAMNPKPFVGFLSEGQNISVED